MSLSVDIEKKLGAFHLRSQFEAPDETMALLGASGCGKSMTLKCIAGIVTPDRGRIVLGGRVLFDSEKKINLPPQQRRVGYLFQQYALFPNMSVEQNILCGIRSGDKAEKRRVLAEKIRMFRLEGMEKKHPAQLSDGQQQRVALARILCSEPEAILLDEPFSALDSYLKWNLELELSDLLAGFHGPILWVSHDLGECCRNCQKVCVMENGVSSPVTDMETLVRHPATQSAARLTGCRNFLPARRCEGGVRLDGWDILLPLHAVGERTTVAVPDGAITAEGGTHTARVSRVIRDLNATAVVLRAAEAPAISASSETKSTRSCTCRTLPQAKIPGTSVSRDWSTTAPFVRGESVIPAPEVSSFSGISPTENRTVSQGR